MTMWTNQLLLSELHVCRSYFERLFAASIDMANLSHHQELKSTGAKMVFDLKEIIGRELYQQEFIEDDFSYFGLREAREFFDQSMTLLEQTILLKALGAVKTCNLACSFMNVAYREANELHHLINKLTRYQVQLPRVSLLEIKETVHELPLFQIDSNQVYELSLKDQKRAQVYSLKRQREQRYKALINEAHQAVSEKVYPKAIDLFEKARNLNDTAEVLTLLAWVHGLVGKNELAKKYCLKAIQKDPNFGPPYNDLGNFLLQEGRIDESIKWFNLAKNALNYQNREYPFINAGRAFLAKKDFSKALEEFGQALTLVPFHEELHQTVKKLKRTLDKSDLSSAMNEQEHQQEPPSIF